MDWLDTLLTAHQKEMVARVVSEGDRRERPVAVAVHPASDGLSVVLYVPGTRLSATIFVPSDGPSDERSGKSE